MYCIAYCPKSRLLLVGQSKCSIFFITIVKTRSKPIIRFQHSNLHMAKINAGKASDMPPNSITKLENADVSVANVNGRILCNY